MQITLVQEGSVVRTITRLDELCREVRRSWLVVAVLALHLGSKSVLQTGPFGCGFHAILASVGCCVNNTWPLPCCSRDNADHETAVGEHGKTNSPNRNDTPCGQSYWLYRHYLDPPPSYPHKVPGNRRQPLDVPHGPHGNFLTSSTPKLPKSRRDKPPTPSTAGEA